MSGGLQTGPEYGSGTSIGALTASSSGTVLTAGSANVKGAYAQLVASSAADACAIIVNMAQNSTPALSTIALDIAIGAAASEQNIVTNFLLQRAGSAGAWGEAIVIPVQIPAGSRISARIASSTGATTTAMAASLVDTSIITDEMPSICEAVGFTSASTLGSVIDCGGVANTKGAYVQLTAATAVDYMGFFLAFDNQNGTAGAVNTKLVDLAIGAAASEVVILPNLLMALDNTFADTPGLVGPIWMPIPAGTRIAARGQCSVTGTADRKVGVTFMGLR